MECRENGSRLHVRVERSGSIVVLDLKGRLTVEADIHRLGGLTQWVASLAGNLVMLDLRGVSRLDCSGIGQLAELRNNVHRVGGTFALVNVERRQQRLLQLVGLLPVFPVFDSRQEALSWFGETAGQARKAVYSTRLGIWLSASLPRVCGSNSLRAPAR